MSQITKLVRHEINKIVEDYSIEEVNSPYNEHKTSVPMDITSKLPKDMTKTAATNVLGKLYGEPELKKILSLYTVETLLAADLALDRMGLIGTPTRGKKRVEAMKDLLELNRGLQGNIDIKKGLIGIMSDYWNKAPIYYDDLQVLFDTMSVQYQDHPKIGESFTNWTRRYNFRDGILGVTENLLEHYGQKFNRNKHKGCFGIQHQGERIALPDVSTRDYIKFLCNENIKVADNTRLYHHIRNYDVEEGAKNWKAALRKARDKSIKELQAKDAA